MAEGMEGVHGMRQMELQADQALKQGLGLPYAMIRSYSQVVLGNTPQAVDEDELIEARFFDAENEIRLFCEDGELRGVRLCKESGDVCVESRFCIENPDFGTEIRVCQHLDTDEDGQTYIRTTRLCGWTGR